MSVVDLTTDVKPVGPSFIDLTTDAPQPAAFLAGNKRARSVDAHPSTDGLVGKGLASLSKTDVADQLAKLLSCPVCLDAPMTDMSVTLCGHLFCGPCIAKVAETLKQCPTCKAKLKKNSAHRIFL